MGQTTRVAGALVLALWGSGAVHAQSHTKNILLTGYWPPTNNMVRRFSPNPAQNPDGWLGQNWNGSGYNIYSFFPEFPGGTGPNWGQGVGDFEIDYQDTSADWERIVPTINPAAIITFSRGGSGSNWEIESRLQMHAPRDWLRDFSSPARPTLDMPIFDTLVPDQWYDSSLPMQGIMDAVNDEGLGINAFIDDTGGGRYLSEFIGLHGLRHKILNDGPDAAFRTFAAGHIHVGIDTPLADAERATELTLEQLTGYLDTVVPSPSGSAVLLACSAMTFVRRRR